MCDRCSCRECRELDATPVEMQGIPGAWQQTLFPAAEMPHMTVYMGECSTCGMLGTAYAACVYCSIPAEPEPPRGGDLFGRRASRLGR